MSKEKFELFERLSARYEAYRETQEKSNADYFEESNMPSLVIQFFRENPNLFVNDVLDNSRFRNNYYLLNESLLDHYSREEKMGLKELYQYVENYDVNKIYFELFFMMHVKLWSKTKFPEFAGKYREAPAYVLDLPGFGVDWPYIWQEMNKLRPLFDEIIMLSNDPNLDIFEYIYKLVELNVKMIYIQPFADGNKRVARAYMNLLLKKVGLPPGYIELDDKNKYLFALKKAAMENEWQYINRLYFHRIAVSIMERGEIAFNYENIIDSSKKGYTKKGYTISSETFERISNETFVNNMESVESKKIP